MVLTLKAKILVVWLSFRWMFRTNLGDLVWYQGKQYRINNGVRLESWRLPGLENGDRGWVPRSECKKVLTWDNYRGSFQRAKSFYLTNWYAIWKRNGVQPWMRGCNIWPKGK